MKGNRFSPRKFAALLLAALLLVSAMAGCAGKTGGGQPRVLRMNISNDVDSMDPWQYAASDTEGIFFNVFEGLTRFTKEGEIIPGLAESWEVSDDRRVYTFHLRQGVKFHNGADFTSADALYTYNALSGLGGEEPKNSKFAVVEKLEAPDDYTFTVTLSQPYAPFLSLTVNAIVPKDYSDQANHPVGAGPFQFAEYVPSQRIVLEKYPDYYRKDADGNDVVRLDRVEIYIMSDSAGVVSALQSGELDLAVQLNADTAGLLRDGFTVEGSAQNMVQGFYLNNAVAPFNDLRVRQAINYAIDKQEIADGALGGAATILGTNFSPMMPLYYNADTENAYPTDLEKAKALLEEAGYGGGFSMRITVPAGYQVHVDTAQIIAEQLKKLGISASIEPVEWATWLEQVYANADYEATVIGLTGKLDADSVLCRFETGYRRNFIRFSDEEYDRVIAQALVETDEEKQVEEYKRCQQILTDRAASVFLTDPNLFIACRKDLHGYAFYPVTFYDFSTLYYD